MSSNWKQNKDFHLKNGDWHKAWRNKGRGLEVHFEKFVNQLTYLKKHPKDVWISGKQPGLPMPKENYRITFYDVRNLDIPRKELWFRNYLTALKFITTYKKEHDPKRKWMNWGMDYGLYTDAERRAEEIKTKNPDTKVKIVPTGEHPTRYQIRIY